MNGLQYIGKLSFLIWVIIVWKDPARKRFIGKKFSFPKKFKKNGISG